MKKLIIAFIMILGLSFMISANSLEDKAKYSRNLGIFGISNFCVASTFFTVSNVFLYKALNYQLSSFEYETDHVYMSGTFNYTIVQSLLTAAVILSAIIMIASIVMIIVGLVYSHYNRVLIYERDLKEKQEAEIPMLILKLEDN